MSKRSQYSTEYKREAVALVRKSRTSCRQVALEMGINPNMLTRWVREAESAVSPTGPIEPPMIAVMEPLAGP